MDVNPKTAMDINQVLPPEIVDKILSYLSIEEMFESCEQVCIQWQRAVIHSTKYIAFGKFMDAFRGFHEHAKILRNPAYRIDTDDKTSYILSKCGRNLRMLQGLYMKDERMQEIAGACKFLHYIDVYVPDLEVLNLLGETFGNQLTCVTLRFFDACNIESFISKCTKLISLATVLYPDDMANDASKTINLFTVHLESPLFAKSLRNLVLGGYINKEMFKHLTSFTKLEMLSVVLHSDVNQHVEWKSLMNCLHRLKALHLKFRADTFLCVECLPSTLEYLSLKRIGWHSNRNIMLDMHNNQRLDVSSFLPKLKSLYIYERHMKGISSHQLESYFNAFCRCTELVKLFISRIEGGSNMDYLIPTFLLFTSLKQLSLRSKSPLTDSFASEIFTKLDHLTSLEMTSIPVIRSHGFQDKRDDLEPTGQRFWKVVKNKAIAHPNDVFKITGRTFYDEPLQLCESFPPNISLVLVGSAFLRLSNGFTKSLQWQNWAKQWHRLEKLDVQIVDENFELNCLPNGLRRLRIKCAHDGSSSCIPGITFATRLPYLHSLSISQQFMSNSHLLSTLECIAKCCPKLQLLFLDRESPTDEGPADEYVCPLFRCENLKELAITKHIILSDDIAERISRKVQVTKASSYAMF